MEKWKNEEGMKEVLKVVGKAWFLAHELGAPLRPLTFRSRWTGWRTLGRERSK
jgi:hypothetical protein